MIVRASLRRTALARFLAGVIAAVALAGVTGVARAEDGPDHAPIEDGREIAERRGDEWVRLADRLARQARAAQPNLLFIGDSISAQWGTAGRDVWDARLAKFRPFTMGIDGDGIQHILWRFDHGALDGVAPSVTVLLAGANNMTWPASRISGGVERLVQEIRKALPATHIIVMAMLPRNNPETHPFRQRALEADDLLDKEPWGDGVTYLNIWGDFVDGSGGIASPLFQSDELHLSPQGYAAWADRLVPTIERYLK